jgi:hypothetical protein
MYVVHLDDGNQINIGDTKSVLLMKSLSINSLRTEGYMYCEKNSKNETFAPVRMPMVPSESLSQELHNESFDKLLEFSSLLFSHYEKLATKNY